MEKAEETKQRRAAAEKAKARTSATAEKFAQAITGRLSGPEQPSVQPRRQKLEAGRHQEALPSAEHIGHMLMAANEKAPISHTGKSVLEAVKRLDKNAESPAERSTGPASDKRIGTISRAELLSLSEQITVDGSSLRQIYESHLVGERGLRRLVAEHLKGGDLKKALRREVVEREIDFERDPLVRDMIPQSMPGSTGSGNGQSNKALDQLLERAAIKISDSGEEAAFFKARAIYEAEQLQQHKQQRRMIDLGVAAAIAILLMLIITLFLTRN
ncbi:MAG TPA: hypothetical protein VII55_02765 [Candidatus Saccharimonadales bacterium]